MLTGTRFVMKPTGAPGGAEPRQLRPRQRPLPAPSQPPPIFPRASGARHSAGSARRVKLNRRFWVTRLPPRERGTAVSWGDARGLKTGAGRERRDAHLRTLNSTSWRIFSHAPMPCFCTASRSACSSTSSQYPLKGIVTCLAKCSQSCSRVLLVLFFFLRAPRAELSARP